jgi:transcriptional regulator with XRE-family HTH domain
MKGSQDSLRKIVQSPDTLSSMTWEGMGERIKRLRTARGLTQSAAARACEMDVQKLAQAEEGADSRASTVAAIAKGLQVPADYLLGLLDKKAEAALLRRPGTALAFGASAMIVPADADPRDDLLQRLADVEDEAREILTLGKDVTVLADVLLRLLADLPLQPKIRVSAQRQLEKVRAGRS